jgi:hypothetical protein
MKHRENARDRNEQAGIDKVASGTDPPAKAKGGRQQRIVAEGPIGVKEAQGLERKGLRVGDGIMKHTPNQDEFQKYRRATG